MKNLSILFEPQDKLDEPPTGAERISIIGETSNRPYSADFRNKVIED